MAKKNRTPLFDRIFKPEHIVLDNGHTVDRPKSRTPLILVAFLIIVFISMQTTNFNLPRLISRIGQFPVILGQIFTPNLHYFDKVIPLLIETMKMSIVGTVVGCIIGLPLAILASSNINKNKPTLLICRFILSILRSIPTLIYATVFALIFNLGAFAGTAAIAIFTLSIVAKMLYEAIETIDMGPFEAMQSFGATTLQSFWTACMPQILPQYFDNCLYCFEMNVRASSILGYVGAGGLGILIRERTGYRQYHDLGTILLTLFVVVWAIDQLNNWIRSKLS
ncbi:MAG: phosphonate ABC transporter, permease protein PhnE [Erysipelotrichaceae bacterium]|nr:phosphonate ABC transporter, permease protein PhnE [Erysipelotrichaceae bacterium]